MDENKLMDENLQFIGVIIQVSEFQGLEGGVFLLACSYNRIPAAHPTRNVYQNLYEYDKCMHAWNANKILRRAVKKVVRVVNL